VPSRFRGKHPDYRASYLRQPSMRLMGSGRDLFARRKDGTEVPVEIGLSPISTAEGPMTLCAIVDITERKAAQGREKILVREVQHRSSNLLSVIQAIARRSLTGSPSLEQAREVFEARLQAIARTNRQLTQSNFVGMNLDEIVRQELEPYAARTMTDGRMVMLDAQQAQNFTLALHELMTNAVKYGALSNPTGSVEISWTATGIGPEKVLKFKWQERGGPPVANPDRQGFGTSLLRALFKDIDFEFAPEGFSCELTATIRDVAAEHTYRPGQEGTSLG
jgi:two-component sensor histidine kinase